MVVRVNRLTVMTVAIFVLAYFIYHSVHGNRGLIAMFNIDHELLTKRDELFKLKEERRELETLVSLLQPGEYNLDFVGELARKDLGLIAPKEKMLVFRKNNYG